MSLVHIIDAGPLVAYLVREDRHHAWSVDCFKRAEPPFLTCESVLSEAFYILGRSHRGPAALIDLLERGVVAPDFSLKDQLEHVVKLMTTYASVPMSLADACLVRMSEIHATSKILTLDSDFKIYRRHSRKVIPLICPE